MVSRLLQLMLYDLSPYYGEWIGSDGRYDYPWLDLYWTEQDRFPYLVLGHGQLAGFALVMAESPITGRAPCWFMAEFFVLKAGRRRGYGRQALDSLLAQHPGSWEIAAIRKNRPAIAFWEAVLTRASVNNLAIESRIHDGQDWLVFAFAS